MTVEYSESAGRDLVQQFRYYLVTKDSPDVAVQFREAVRTTANLLSQFPLLGARYLSNKPGLESFRSWPVSGFKDFRIYYLAKPDSIHLVRILHGKRNVSRILKAAVPKKPS